MRVAVIARGAWSALGRGRDATRPASRGDVAATGIRPDAELESAGLVRPWAARAGGLADRADVDRATALLEGALADCFSELDRALPEWRSLRVGAAIGTSSGGMRSFERFVGGEPTPPLAATYVGPLAQAARPLALAPVSLVLGACASSALAIGVGRAWLIEDRCDVALCGGFDAVSVFVAAGFECLRATCGQGGPQPFRAARDGLALGEGAGVVALVRGSLGRKARVFVTGFGATCDAKHLTAPDPEGRGLLCAARAALAEAGSPAIALVSAHGTATLQNDQAEARSIRALGSSAPVFAAKGTLGHTLGAAGVLELLATIDALGAQVAPATYGSGLAEPGVRLVDRSEANIGVHGLKLAAAFGGANAAIVVALDDERGEPSEPCERERGSGSASPPRPAVFVSRGVIAAETSPAELAALSGYPEDRIARGDGLVRLALSAVATLVARLGRDVCDGAGLVLGHGLATVETNALFAARLRAAGAARAEPRRFPYTTPNAAAGECAVAFGLRGPVFAVGGGPHGGVEALGVAATLVRSGVAARMIVVAADEAARASEELAPGTASGAVAALVASDSAAGAAIGGMARLEDWTVRFEPNRGASPSEVPDPLPPMAAHDALIPLAGGNPELLQAAVPWGGFAKAHLFWL